MFYFENIRYQAFQSSQTLNILTLLSQCCLTCSNILSIFRRAPRAATPLAASASSSNFIISCHFMLSKIGLYLCNLRFLNQAGISSKHTHQSVSQTLGFPIALLTHLPKVSYLLHPHISFPCWMIFVQRSSFCRCPAVIGDYCYRCYFCCC